MPPFIVTALASMLIPVPLQLEASRPSDRETVLTRTFDASRLTVFEALTRPEHLGRWMTPPHLELVDCQVDLRAGGSFRRVYRRGSGASIEVRGQYDIVHAPNRFVYTETYDFSPLRILVTTTLDEVGGKTLVTQSMAYESKAERDNDFDAVVGGATSAYAYLDRYLVSLQRRP